jgi:hypothetical protein
MNDAAQWFAIGFLFLALLHQVMTRDEIVRQVMAAVPPPPVPGTGGASTQWVATIKKGSMQWTRTIQADTEAEAVKVLLSDGIDPAHIAEIHRA